LKRRRNEFMAYRKESDVLGTVKVPGDAYYGSETERALENFQISGLRTQKDFIHAYVTLKKAAAMANRSIGKLDAKRADAIIRACDRILAGRYSDQFVLDVFQAGAGTSTNMNVNEVIANIAIEILGGRKGDYSVVHPNDHVNMSQSTNDTFPSTINIAAYIALQRKLMPSLRLLQRELEKKSREFSRTVKIGRTHLQDAVPMTLGQEFYGYAGSVWRAMDLLEGAGKNLLEIPLGGTAVGTGMNAGKAYQRAAIQNIGRLTKLGFKPSKNKFSAMQSRIEVLALSDALKQTAIVLSKIANDFRLLGSGPRAGIGELILPAVQPGSSIMPGKINPSMAEMLNMACFQVMGNDTTITEAANSGQLELNVFMPIMAFDLLFSIDILAGAVDAFTKRCVKGVRANTQKIDEHLDQNLSLATALTPYIGYSKAAKIARIAYMKNKSIKEVCLELKIMDRKKLEKILDPKNLVGL
jgi:fumarate hydratase, class II